MLGLQYDFLEVVDRANVPAGAYWVRIRENSGHRVYRAGTRFLVVGEAEGKGFLRCWRDGKRPPRGILGVWLHPKYVEVDREASLS